MITILGENINVVRPKLIKQPRVFKDEQPTIKYNCYQPKRNKDNSGKVVRTCVLLKGGGIRSVSKGMHIDVVRIFDIDTENIDRVGWELDNGNFVWR